MTEAVAGIVETVQEGLSAALSATPPGSERAGHLAKVADALRHRAALEDQLARRRAAAAEDLRRLTQDTARAIDHVDTSGDPFSAVLHLATPLVRATANGSSTAADILQAMVWLLVGTELPEVGEAAGAERNRLEAEAMNRLGTEEAGTLSPELVERYLRDSGVRSDHPRVRRVVRLAGGFSKHTTLVHLTGGNGPEEIVLRQAPPGRPAPGLAAEFSVVQLAWCRGIPVPEPLWIEPSANDLGNPFFACRRVAGSNQGDVFGPGPDVSPSVGHDLARIAARLHALDVSDLDTTPIPPMASADGIRDRIAEQQAIATTAAGAGWEMYRPLYALLFAWLRSHVPADTTPHLVHGDVGFHNILVSDGNVRALLDWERSTIGDPALDLAYVRPQVETIMTWDAFVDSYVGAGGTERSPRVLRFYTVWQDTWRAAGALKGRGRFIANPVHLADAVTGLLHSPRFLLSAVANAFGDPHE